MFIDFTGIDLFDPNVGMACAIIRFKCSWKSLVLIYLIKTLFMACVEVRVRCLWISPVLVYLIKMQVKWANKLDSDVHGYH